MRLKAGPKKPVLAKNCPHRVPCLRNQKGSTFADGNGKGKKREDAGPLCEEKSRNEQKANHVYGKKHGTELVFFENSLAEGNQKRSNTYVIAIRGKKGRKKRVTRTEGKRIFPRTEGSQGKRRGERCESAHVAFDLRLRGKGKS